MNNRIRELAEQTGYKHPDAVGTIEDYAYFDHEKFAELIIKECVEVANKLDDPKNIYYIGDQIKEHFGVD